MIRQWARLVVVGAVALVAAAGCTDDSSREKAAPRVGVEGEGHQVLTPEEMEAEYWEATEELTLPVGAGWPPIIHLSPEPDHNGILRGHSYVPGYGTLMAYEGWFCAWSRAWLAARGEDPEGEAEVLETLLSFSEFEHYDSFYDITSQEATEQMLSEAQVGDPSGVARHVDLNCGPPA